MCMWGWGGGGGRGSAVQSSGEQTIEYVELQNALVARAIHNNVKLVDQPPFFFTRTDICSCMRMCDLCGGEGVCIFPMLFQ